MLSGIQVGQFHFGRRFLGDYEPCTSPGQDEALIDLYGDGSMIMCVPINTLASLTSQGARVISYGPVTPKTIAPAPGAVGGGVAPVAGAGVAKVPFMQQLESTIGISGTGLAIGMAVVLFMMTRRK